MFVEAWLESVDPVEQPERPEPSELGACSWEVLSAAEEAVWAAVVADLEAGDPLAMAPGWPLAVHLDSVNLDKLTGEGLVGALRAHARMVSHHQAQLSRLVIAVSDRLGGLEAIDAEDVAHATVAELRAALHLTRRAAETELDLAISLCRRLPAVFTALEQGLIDLRRVRVLIDTTSHLPESTAREVCAQVLGRAGGMTTGQLAAHLRRVCIESDPDHAQLRYEQALDERVVVAEPSLDGTVTITASKLPAERAAAVMERLTRIAKALKTSEESRTLDQLRADILIDLLDGSRSFDQTRGSVDIRVDLTTLMQLNDNPAVLGGYGPVVADIARKVMKTRHKTQWQYTVTHRGGVVGTGTTSRRPTASTRRAVTRRDTTCIFPGCRTPATNCDLDHRQPHSEGGPADSENLVPLCRHDHTMRHATGWTHTPNPDGTHTWTSPLGTTYTTQQPP